MRGRVRMFVAVVVLSAALAGCLSGDEPEPALPLTSGTAESQARDAVSTEAGDDVVLLAAFGVAAADPTRLAVSSAYPALSELSARMLALPASVPGDGTLPAWAYLYEDPDSDRVIGAVVTAGAAAAGGDELVPVVPENQVWVREAAVDRAELALLRANGTLTQAPEVDSRAALDKALTIAPWAQIARGEDAFVLFVLSADGDGNALWRLIAATYDGGGLLVRIDGATGEQRGTVETWPDPPAQAVVREETGVRAPGDERGFTITVPERGGKALHVTAARTSTFDLVELLAPAATLTDPSGNAALLEIGVPYVAPDPAPGEWTLVFNWDFPDLYRSIGLDSCLEPAPFLFGEDVDDCDAAE